MELTDEIEPERRRRPRGAARAALIDAAWLEFNEVGFDGTDTNRIARRAGYSPQTFYWHFPDKAAIFVSLFARHVQTEFAAIAAAAPGGVRSVAAAIIATHTATRIFRRSLNYLSIIEPKVRAARLIVRRRQIEELCVKNPDFDPAAAAVFLLTTDRLADAAAEGDLEGLGLGDAAEILVQAWTRLSPSGQPPAPPLEFAMEPVD